MSKTSYWEKRKVERYLEAEKIEKQYKKNIQGIYKQAYKNIDKELQSIYKNYSNQTGLDQQQLKQILTKSETKKTFEELKKQGLDKYVKNNYKARINRLEQIQAQMYAKAKEIYPSEELFQKECLTNVIKDGYYRTIYDIEKGTGHMYQFSRINENTITRLLNDKWSGENYSTRIWANTDILADNLQEIVGGGLLTGESYAKMSRQIRERFNVARYYSDRLARTEVNYFHNQADAIASQELGFDKYVITAILDTRTSDICQDMDGEVFEYSKMEVGRNYPPFHPNCRTTTTVYLGEELESKIKRTAINPITEERELIDNISYKEWFKNTAKVDKNNKTDYNKDDLLGTGEEYKPKYDKIRGNHTIEDDLKHVNPNFNREDLVRGKNDPIKTKPEWYKNCQRCVPTYEMRRRGYNVEAKPKYQSDIIAKKPQVVFKNPDIKYFNQDIEHTIIGEMEKWGEGSRCQIVSYWKHGGGHTFVAEMEKGKVRFIDPQYGGVDVSNYIKAMKVKNSYFYRIDNLEFTDYIKDCCKGVVNDARKSAKNSE